MIRTLFRLARDLEIQRFAVLTVCLPLGLTSCYQPTPDEEVGSESQAIIGGTVPAKGDLESWGVVALSSGCSGVLLTNRHVLTAHHCVRDLGTAPFVSYVPMDVTLEKPAATGDEVIRASNVFEHPQPYSLEHRDYAILVLDSPISVTGSANGFYRSAYTGADSTLKGKSVFCAGYGMTQLAKNVNGVWVPGGSGKLTSAFETIDDVWSSGTLIRKVHNGVVGAGGDSGSPCFFLDGANWTVTGPQSNCPDFDTFDINGDGQFDWSEATAIRECRGAAPSTFRSMISDNLFAQVTVLYDSLPALPAGSIATGVVTTTAASFDVDAFDGQIVSAPRSGKVEVKVTTEPPNTMCPRVSADAPMTGSRTITGRCLGDGLVSALL